MSDNQHALSVTLKAGAGFDSPWIVIYGDNPDEVERKVAAISAGSLMQTVVEASNLLRGAFAASPLVAGGGGAPAPAQGAPIPAPQQQSWGGQPQAARPHPEGQSCSMCGTPLEYKSGTSQKTGKAYALWACPKGRQRGDGHDTKFVN